LSVRIGILEPDGFSYIARERLGVLGEVSDFAGGALAEFTADKDVLFVRLAHRVDDAFLGGAPRLRVLCSPTTGHTHVDLDTLEKRQVRLISLKGETEFLERIRATPEHAIGLALALLRNYRVAFLDKGNARWDRNRCRGEELSGTAVGLVGFGRVGRRLARYLAAFEADVGYYDRHVDLPVAGIRRFGSLGDLISASRIVILCANYEPGTPPVVDAACVALLAGRYFINIARGELVDEDALLSSIEAGALAGCAVDVIANENGANNLPRWIAATQRKNLIVTPHIGGATFASMRATEEFIADKLIAMTVQNQAKGG
jgi:D-3-phosphoglycerate dehydrogenase